MGGLYPAGGGNPIIAFRLASFVVLISTGWLLRWREIGVHGQTHRRKRETNRSKGIGADDDRQNDKKTRRLIIFIEQFSNFNLENIILVSLHRSIWIYLDLKITCHVLYTCTVVHVRISLQKHVFGSAPRSSMKYILDRIVAKPVKYFTDNKCASLDLISQNNVVTIIPKKQF